MEDFHRFDDGAVILGEFPSINVIELIRMYCPNTSIPLVLMDPDYDRLVDLISSDLDICSYLCRSMKVLETICCKGAALYIIGNIGFPGDRPFYRLLIKSEQCTDWRLNNKIIWRKRKSEDSGNNYAECYEELGYFILGDGLGKEIIPPRLFNTPFLDKPKSKFGIRAKLKNQVTYFTRNNVWLDISEMIRNKISKNQKPEKLIEIPIQVHTKVGDWVFDPFSRYAVTAIVARKLARKFIVVASTKEEFDYCVTTLKI